VKHPPLKNTVAYVVVDTDGRVCWGLLSTMKRAANFLAQHPRRRIARVTVDESCIVRKAPQKKPKRRAKK
jgi:hypothetical protein